MKFKFIILLALMGSVAAKDLTAEIIGVPSFSGCNCKADNTPNTVEIGINVQNPSYRPMQLSYMLYGPNNSSLEGDKLICNGHYSNDIPIPANNYGSCRLQLRTLMGGMNGTEDVKMLLIGWDGVDYYTKSLTLSINHHTSPYETNIVSRMLKEGDDLNKLNSELQKYCQGGVCCSMVVPKNFIPLASSNLSQANLSLKNCKLSESWDYIMNCSNLIHAANDSFFSMKSNCSASLSAINSTELKIISVANLILDGKQCGASVNLSELQLKDANNSLKEARDAVSSDDYSLALSKLREANSSILSSIKSIGKCPSASKPPEPVVTPAKQNTTNESSNQTSSGNNTLLVLGGAFLGLLILAAAVAAVLLITRARPTEETQSPLSSKPAARPTAPPPAPEIHEDLEKEFNEWLESHSKK